MILVGKESGRDAIVFLSLYLVVYFVMADDDEISEHEIHVNSEEEIRKLLVSIEHNDDHEINEPEITGNSAEEVRKLLVSLGLE